MAKKIFTTDENVIGMHWFEPLNGEEWQEGVPSKGIGEEKYREGSVYVGEMEYNGEIFYKQGHGKQEFSKSEYLDGEKFGGPEYSLTLLYEGDFDHYKADWMYGNGIVYFTSQDGTPIAFAKGFMTGVATYTEWEGEFDYNTLLSGFTKEMEIDLHAFRKPFREYREKYTAEGYPKSEYVFFGDSWFDLWRKHNDEIVGSEFDEDKGDMSAVNVGVGGTRFSDWTDERMNDLVFKFGADKFVINLGFNDLHSGQTMEYVQSECLRVINLIKGYNKDAKVYLCSLTHCNAYVPFWERETILNEWYKTLAANDKNVIYLATGELFCDKNGNPFEDIDDYCISDRLHLNRKGYDVWGPYILTEVRK